MSLIALVAIAIGGIAAGVFVSGGDAGTTAVTPIKVTVKASEFKYVLSKKTVAPGSTVIFTVINKGKLPHDFKIAGKKSKMLNGGQKATLKVVFPKKKTSIAFLCTVTGHAKLGMKGVFGVGLVPKITTTPTTPTTPTVTTPTPTTPTGPETLQGDPTAGRAIFIREACGSCHTLAAVPGATGGILNLDIRKPGQAAVRSAVQNGFAAGGNTMPAFSHLSQAELNNIAAFVYQATH